MDPLNKRFSSHRPKRNPEGSTTVHRKQREKFGLEQPTIVPVPREELPDEMRSVLESFISSQRPSLADIRSTRPEAQRASTSAPSQSQASSVQGHEWYDYDSRNENKPQGLDPRWPFSFTLKGRKPPSPPYHTHKVAPRSRPHAKEKRNRHPSRRRGRVIQQEDYNGYTRNQVGQTVQFLNSESLLDLSVRGEKAAIEKATGGGGWWRWPRGGESRLGRVARVFCRG